MSESTRFNRFSTFDNKEDRRTFQLSKVNHHLKAKSTNVKA